MKNTTFILHGKYDTTHLPMCEELSYYGNVIVSTTSRNLNSDELDREFYDLVLLNKELTDPGIYNHQNIYNHINSVLNAAKLCNSTYIVKMPMKYCFSNIEYIIRCLEKNESNSYLCSNMTINPEMPFHFCDNIIAGKTQLIRGIFQTAYEMIINYDLIYEGIDSRICAEIFLFASYLKYKKLKMGSTKYFYHYADYIRNKQYDIAMPENYQSIVTNNLKIIDVDCLAPYTLNPTFNNLKINNDIKSAEQLIELSRYK